MLSFLADPDSDRCPKCPASSHSHSQPPTDRPSPNVGWSAGRAAIRLRAGQKSDGHAIRHWFVSRLLSMSQKALRTALEHFGGLDTFCRYRQKLVIESSSRRSAWLALLHAGRRQAGLAGTRACRAYGKLADRCLSVSQASRSPILCGPLELFSCASWARYTQYTRSVRRTTRLTVHQNQGQPLLNELRVIAWLQQLRMSFVLSVDDNGRRAPQAHIAAQLPESSWWPDSTSVPSRPDGFSRRWLSEGRIRTRGPYHHSAPEGCQESRGRAADRP